MTTMTNDNKDDADETITSSAATVAEALVVAGEHQQQMTRERFLDRFPVTDAELDVLLSLQQETSSSSSWRQQVDIARRCMDWAVDNVCVMGFDQEQQEQSSQVYQQAIFLEAAVSVLGRRGEAFLHRLLFHVLPTDTTALERMSWVHQLVAQCQLLQHVQQLQQKPFGGDDEEDDDNKTGGEEKKSNHDTDSSSAAAIPASSAAAASSLPPTNKVPASWVASLRTKVAAAKKTNNTGFAAAGRMMRHNKKGTSKKTNNNQEEKKVDNDDDTVSWAAWKMWMTESAPWLHTVVSTLFWQLWLAPEQHSAKQQKLQPPLWSLPRILCPSDWDMLHLPAESLEWMTPLASMLGPSRHDLYALYSSLEQGLSFGTIQQALLSYTGPTLLVCGSTEGHVVGYVTQAPWKQGSISLKAATARNWHGATVIDRDTGDEYSNEAFLFSLKPAWQMFARTYATSNSVGLQCLQTAAAARLHEHLPFTGMAVGGMHPDTPRFLLTTSLEQCQFFSQDKAFASGSLVPAAAAANEKNVGTIPPEDEACTMFDVEWAHVYAVVPSDNDDDSNNNEEKEEKSSSQERFAQQRAAGQRAANVREWHRQRAAHVDKAQFVDFLQVYGTSNLYAHRQQARGRTSFVAHDDETRGYYVEGKEPSSALELNDDNDDDNNDDDDGRRED